ncbi:MAG: deoxyribodipyrimidine photo-lyase [Saprospiraceae bacterium]
MFHNIFWFRRDLRLSDNAGLFHALKDGLPVIPVFIFDTQILGKLSDRSDPRVTFIYDTILKLKQDLQSIGSDLDIRYGNPYEVWTTILQEYKLKNVFTNHDFESYAVDRDNAIGKLLEDNHIGFRTYKDHVIFEKNEVVKDDGKPYTVFTPYKRKWIEKLSASSGSQELFQAFEAYRSEDYTQGFCKTLKDKECPDLSAMGFERSCIPMPSETVSQAIIKNYDKDRDFPAIIGTSRLGLHFRFGTISIREKAKKAIALNQTFLSELIWRDFYAMILYHFPHVEKKSFRPEYDNIVWRNDVSEFTSWCEGRTGYPIVDAGMRELSATGFMHNRVRMITASFLTKHLLIDWRWGEAWFAEKLLDFDLASNNGGWQWAAGCGTDAAPYFRIFSPDAQTEKFDRDRDYIKTWVTELGTSSYPTPIVDHKFARERCLSVYKAGLGR